MRQYRQQQGALPSPPRISRFRALAPRQNTDEAYDKDQEDSKTQSGHIRVACNRSCDGRRPSCSRCIKAKIRWEYITAKPDVSARKGTKDQLQRLRCDLELHTAFLDRLRSATEPDAIAILRQLRSGVDVSALLSAVESEMCTLSAYRPSDIETDRAISPPTESRFEFELSSRHYKVYPALTPLEMANIDLDAVLRKHSRPSTPAFSPVPALLSIGGGINPRALTTDDPLLTNGSVTKVSARIEQYCDARLNGLRVDFWTRVPIGDEFAAAAISNYLETEHPILGFFDVDIVLDALVNHDLRSCSSFLVCAVLCLACQCYSGFDARASSLGVIFLDESIRLWHAERLTDSVTTLTAMAVMCAACTWQGKEQFAAQLMTDVRRMAEKMCLFGVLENTQLAGGMRRMTTEQIRLRAHAAWGAFCFLSLHSSYYNDEPIVFPPLFPIPGLDYNCEMQRSSSRWPGPPLPSYMGHTFPTICMYWILIQEIQVVYSPLTGAPTMITLAFAESKYRKLLSWAASLSEDMDCSLGQIHVQTFHALYHIAILNLFRPFLKVSPNQRLASFSSLDGSPKAAFNASFKHLKRIVVDYVVNYNSKLYCPVFSAAVLHVNSLIIQDATEPDWRFYYKLCMSFWKGAVIRHPCMANVARATLSMGMSTGCIGSAEARVLTNELDEQMRHHGAAEVEISCIVDFDRAMRAVSEGRAQELVAKFDELAILNELTTVN